MFCLFFSLQSFLKIKNFRMHLINLWLLFRPHLAFLHWNGMRSSRNFFEISTATNAAIISLYKDLSLQRYSQHKFMTQ